jgi:hypothetical protein
MALEVIAPLGRGSHQVLAVADPAANLIFFLVVALVFFLLAALVARANLFHLPTNPLRWHYWVAYEANELSDVRVRYVLILCVISICALIAAAFIFLGVVFEG